MDDTSQAGPAQTAERGTGHTAGARCRPLCSPAGHSGASIWSGCCIEAEVHGLAWFQARGPPPSSRMSRTAWRHRPPCLHLTESDDGVDQPRERMRCGWPQRTAPDPHATTHRRQGQRAAGRRRRRTQSPRLARDARPPSKSWRKRDTSDKGVSVALSTSVPTTKSSLFTIS